ncbi:MAG: PEGA domain-containing protein, partial [Oscillospiraceae bacterium]|nr:PEGA domain-containing protein [Oscillospiraceae bacterium]
IDVESEIGRMMDFVVTFYGKMGDVYVITEEPAEIPAGDYTVVVESESYVPHREEITVVPGEQIVTDFTDIEFVPQEEYVPFSSGTVVTVGSKAY